MIFGSPLPLMYWPDFWLGAVSFLAGFTITFGLIEVWWCARRVISNQMERWL